MSTPSLSAIQPPETASTDDHTQHLPMATRLLDTMHTQVRSADEKLRGLFGATALLAAALTFTAQQRILQLQSTPWGIISVLDLALFAFFVVAVAWTIIAGLLGLIPRVDVGKIEHSLFFFGHIAAMKHDQFIDEFSQISAESATKQILSQVYVNAHILQNKYRWIRQATVAFIVSIGLLIANVTVVFFSMWMR